MLSQDRRRAGGAGGRPVERRRPVVLEDGLRGGMIGRVERLDWAATALGARGSWPGALRAASEVALHGVEPACVGWGPELLTLYNDAWIPLLGAEHPGALGRAGARTLARCWPEIWGEIRPVAEAVGARRDVAGISRRPVELTGRPGRPARRFLASVTPLRDDGGVVMGFHCAASEVVEPDLTVAVEAQRRARNTLATVRSLIRRTKETSTDVEDYARRLEGRADAVSRAQGAGPDGEAAALDLEFLVSDELVAADVEEERFLVTGPRVVLRGKTAEVLSLVIYELVANAVDHGALASPEGRLDVGWTAQPSGAARPVLRLVWSEDGLRDLSPPARRGFGLELLERMLPYELRASVALAWRPTGLRCELAMELPSRAADG